MLGFEMRETPTICFGVPPRNRSGKIASSLVFGLDASVTSNQKKKRSGFYLSGVHAISW